MFDIVSIVRQVQVMRDDIHKRVPRPPCVQRWVKLSVNDADRANGRSIEALRASIQNTCGREISSSFLQGIRAELSGASGMFKPLEMAGSARQVGGRGGHLETEVFNEVKRLLGRGDRGDGALVNALAGALENRCQADIRATQAVLPPRDPKTGIVLRQMRKDAANVNFVEAAQKLCIGEAA